MLHFVPLLRMKEGIVLLHPEERSVTKGEGQGRERLVGIIYSIGYGFCTIKIIANCFLAVVANA